MRHGDAFRKLSRTPKERLKLLGDLAGSLFREEQIVTTVPRAKELRRYAEKIITLGKKGTEVASLRVLEKVNDVEGVRKVLTVFRERYKDRHGGYTRLLRLGPRKEDSAQMAMIEMVDWAGDYRKVFLPKYQ